MSHFDENIFSHDNALHATSEAGTFVPLDTVSPTWQVNNGTYRTTDAREARYVPEFFSIVITPSNTSPVLLYLENQPLPTISINTFIAKFHARVLCDAQITATAKIGPTTEVIPDGIATVGTASNWFVANSNDHHVPIGANYSGLKVQLSIAGHGGLPIYVTMPVLLNDHGFRQNNFVINGRKYVPTYYWDIDSQQEAPTHPFFKILDIFTSDADKSVNRYVDWFEFETDELLPSVQDSAFTKSTLTNPDWVDPENRDWLAQFTGNKLKTTVRTTAYNWTTFERTSTSQNFTQGDLMQVYDLMAGSMDLETESTDLAWREIGRQMFSGSEGRLYGCRTSEFGSNYSIRFNSDVGAGTSLLVNNVGALVEYRDPKTLEYRDFNGVVYLRDQIDSGANTDYAVAFSFEGTLYDLLRIIGEVWVFSSVIGTPENDYGKYGVIHPRIDVDKQYLHNNTLSQQARGGLFIRCSQDGTIVFTSRSVSKNFCFELYDPNDYSSYPATAGDLGISHEVGEFIDLSSDGTVFITSGKHAYTGAAGHLGVYKLSHQIGNYPLLSSTRMLLTGVNVDGVATNRDGSTIAYVEVNNSTTDPYLLHVMDWDGSSYQDREIVEIPNSTLLTNSITSFTGSNYQNLYKGLQISMSDDGNRIALANQWDGTYGAVYCFHWENGHFVTRKVFSGSTTVGDLGPAVAIDSYGRTIACGGGAKGWVLDWTEPTSALDDRDYLWRLRSDSVTGQNYVSAPSYTSQAFFSTADISDGGDVVVWGALNAGGSGASPVMMRWDRSTSSWVDLGTDFASSMPNLVSPSTPSYGCGVAVPNWASMPQRSDYGDILKRLYWEPTVAKFDNFGNPIVRRALLVWFQGANAGEGQQEPTLDALLDVLPEGEKFYISIPPDDYAWQISYGGSFSFGASIDTSNFSDYIIPYKGRVSRVGGQGNVVPEIGEFQDPNSVVLYANKELMPSGVLNFPTSSTTSNLWSDPNDIDDFIRWQLKTLYYGINSGSRESMIEAVKQVLTVDDGTVAVSPNYNGEKFRIHLRTLFAETPDYDNYTTISPAVLNAAEPTRPAGFIFTHETVAKLFFTLNNIGIGRMDRSVLG